MADIRTSKLFRKETLDRVGSPEQLDEYIRVSNPSVWLVLVLIVLLLVAGVIWACVGQMTESLSTTLVVQENQAVCYVAEGEVGQLEPGQQVTAGDATGTVVAVEQPPVSPDSIATHYDEYTAHRINAMEWSCPVRVSIDLPDGLYAAHVTTGKFAPISLIFGSAS